MPSIHGPATASVDQTIVGQKNPGWQHQICRDICAIKQWMSRTRSIKIKSNRSECVALSMSWDLTSYGSFVCWDCCNFFFDLCGCSGQLARITTNLMAHWTPCKLSEYVRHRGGDRRAHENSNPGAAGGDKPLLPPGQDPQCWDCCNWKIRFWI